MQNLGVQSFFSFYHYDRRGPRTTRGPYHFLFQHPLKLFLFLSSYFRILPPVGLSNRGSSCMNFMFNYRRIAQLQSFTSEYILEFLEKGLQVFFFRQIFRNRRQPSLFHLSSRKIWFLLYNLCHAYFPIRAQYLIFFTRILQSDINLGSLP